MKKILFFVVVAVFIVIGFNSNKLSATSIDDIEGILPLDDQDIMTTIITQENQDIARNMSGDLLRVKVFYDQLESGTSGDWNIVTGRYAVVVTRYSGVNPHTNNIHYLRFNAYFKKTDGNNESVIEFQLKVTRSMNYIYYFSSGIFWESANTNICFGLFDINLSLFSSDDEISRFYSYAELMDYDNQPNSASVVGNVILNSLESAIIDSENIPYYSKIKMVSETLEVIYLNYISSNTTSNSNFSMDRNLTGENRRLVNLQLSDPVFYSDNNWDLSQLDPVNQTDEYDYFGAVYHIDKGKIKEGKEIYVNLNFSLRMIDESNAFFILHTGDQKYNIITEDHSNTITMKFETDYPYQEISVPYIKNIESTGGTNIFYTFTALKANDYYFYHNCDDAVEIELIDEDYNVVLMYSSWTSHPSILHCFLEEETNYFLRIKTINCNNFNFTMLEAVTESDDLDDLSIGINYYKSLKNKSFAYYQMDVPIDGEDISYTINSRIAGARTDMWLFDSEGLLIAHDFGDFDHNGARISIELEAGETYFVLLYMKTYYYSADYTIQFYETDEEVFHLDWHNLLKVYFDPILTYDYVNFTVFSSVYDLVFNEATKTIVFGAIECYWDVVFDYHPNNSEEYVIGMIIGTTYDSIYNTLPFFSFNGYYNYNTVLPYTYSYSSIVTNVAITFSDSDWANHVSLGPR